MSKLTKDEVRANRLKWLEALESGEYRQVHGNGLAVNGAYCCLGVACEVMGGGEWAGREYSFPDGSFVDSDGAGVDSLARCVSGPLLRWLGMSDDARWACINWNDNTDMEFAAPLTFPEIAQKMRGRWRLPKEQG